jgi:hypothetical protein
MSGSSLINMRFLRTNQYLLYIYDAYGIHITKPALMYNDDGGFRPFGVGYRHKTIIPSGSCLSS